MGKKQKNKSLITGEGADEVFGGYSKVYQPTYFLTALKNLTLNFYLKFFLKRILIFFDC